MWTIVAAAERCSVSCPGGVPVCVKNVCITMHLLLAAHQSISGQGSALLLLWAASCTWAAYCSRQLCAQQQPFSGVFR